MFKIVALLLMLGVLGCGTMSKYQYNSNRIDPISIRSQEQFQFDCQTCTGIADEWQRQANNEMLGRALVGAILGAGMGAAMGGIVGGSDWAGMGAGVGGVSGAAAGAGSTPNYRDTVFYNCMRNRGYQLLW